YSAGLTTSGGTASNKVWPSGAALIAASVPMLVAPPGRLTITTGWPRRPLIGPAIARATESVAPPGGYGTIHCSGRSGNCAARAGRPRPMQAAPANAPCSKVRRFMVVSLFCARAARMLGGYGLYGRIPQLALDHGRAGLRARPNVLTCRIGERLEVPGRKITLQPTLLHQPAARLALEDLLVKARRVPLALGQLAQALFDVAHGGRAGQVLQFVGISLQVIQLRRVSLGHNQLPPPFAHHQAGRMRPFAVHLAIHHAGRVRLRRPQAFRERPS